MTTNQEGRQAAIRDSTSTAYGVAADWHSLFDDAGISAGTFNERLLAWINAELSASYSNLVSAMQAYAEDAGYDGWEDMATLVLAMNGAETLLDGETQGLAFDFTDQSALIIDTGKPANNYDSTGIVSSGALVGPGGKLTYTSPSNKLCRQADGYYKYGAHNLYLNSASPANQSITVVSGASYAVTITGTVSVTASGAATGTWTAGTNTFTAATTTLTLGSTSGSGTVHVYRTPAVTDYVATAGSAVYALPFSYAADGSCEGLLVEEARTNLLTYSTQLDNAAWVKDGLLATSVTANSTVGISGLTDMDTITFSGGTGALYQDVTVSSGATVSWSGYFKAGTGSILLLQIENITNAARAWFNLSTGVKLSTANVNTGVASASHIEDAGGGIYRCTLVGSIPSVTSYRMKIIAVDADGSATRISGTIICGHTQAEAGAFPTSPIIAYGATATRAADQKSQLTSALPFSATAGSLYAYVVPYAGSDLAGIVSLNDGSGDEEIVIYKDASANIVAQVEDGGVGQLAPLDSTVNASSNTAFKVALAWAANDFALSANGTAAQTDTGGTLPTVTTLEIGADQANNYFNGIIKAIAYWPRRRANSELVTVTT